MSRPRRLHAVEAGGKDTQPVHVALTAPRAEQALIAAVIDADTHRANGEDLPDVIAAVGGSSLLPAFSDSTARRVWELLCERHRRGEPNDLLSVAEVIRTENLHFGTATLQASDLVAWVDELIERTQTAIPSLAECYAREVRETATRRTLHGVARALTETLERDPRPLRDWYAEAAAPLVRATTPAAPEMPLSQRVVALMDDVSQLLELNHTRVTGVPSGLTALDTHTGGFRGGDLVVVAGRTGLGKTAFGLTVALNAAQRGIGVCFVSCEMSVQALLQRLLAQLSGIEISRLWRGPLGSRDHTHLVHSARTLAELPLQFVELKRNWPEIADDCRRAVGRGARLVILDYLGLMTILNSRMDRWEMIGAITAEAKQLALTTAVPVLLLAQLNREVVRETNKRPCLWHLRDSGSIEQDADLVVFVHREHAYDPRARPDIAELIVAKFRNGPTGSVTVRWRPELARFEDQPGDDRDQEPEDRRYNP